MSREEVDENPREALTPTRPTWSVSHERGEFDAWCRDVWCRNVAPDTYEGTRTAMWQAWEARSARSVKASEPLDFTHGSAALHVLRLVSSGQISAGKGAELLRAVQAGEEPELMSWSPHELVCGYCGGDHVDLECPKVRVPLLEDAARWRALRHCARITAMGSAGMSSTSPDAHVTLNFWTHNQRETETYPRQWLDIFVKKAMALGNVKAPTDLNVVHVTGLPDSLLQQDARRYRVLRAYTAPRILYDSLVRNGQLASAWQNLRDGQSATTKVDELCDEVASPRR